MQRGFPLGALIALGLIGAPSLLSAADPKPVRTANAQPRLAKPSKSINARPTAAAPHVVHPKSLTDRSAPFGFEERGVASVPPRGFAEQQQSIVGDRVATERKSWALLVGPGHEEPTQPSSPNPAEQGIPPSHPDGTTQERPAAPAGLPTDLRGKAFWPTGYVHDAVVALVGERGIICTGTLIRKRAVLTAGHCRTAGWVLVGSVDSRGARRMQVRRFALPPNAVVDAAVAVLAEDAPVEPYAMRGAGDGEPPDAQLRLVGFGVNDLTHMTGAGVRRWADIRVAGWGCDPNTEQLSGCMASLEMVIRAQDGVDTCAGDSGGPVLEIFEGKPRLVAITSRGVRNGSDACGAGGVYVRVDRLRQWLDREKFE